MNVRDAMKMIDEVKTLHNWMRRTGGHTDEQLRAQYAKVFEIEKLEIVPEQAAKMSRLLREEPSK